jgi:hypothetical protein
MQHPLPHLSPPGGCVALQQAVAAVALAPLVAVAALVVVFAMTRAVPSQS